MALVTEVTPEQVLALLSVGSSLRPPEWTGPTPLAQRRADGWYDRFASPTLVGSSLRGFRDWWQRHDGVRFDVPAGAPRPREYREVLELRGAVRLLADGDVAGYQRRLRRLLQRTAFRIDETGQLQPAGPAWSAFVARLLPALIEMGQEPERIRYCANVECRWVFFDRSRSGRRRWCHPESCGNRMKVRAFRARQRRVARADRIT